MGEIEGEKEEEISFPFCFKLTFYIDVVHFELKMNSEQMTIWLKKFSFLVKSD